MKNQENATQTIRKRVPWKGKLTGGEASTAAQTCLVNPDETSD
jgi:hypothetical protein